MLQPARLCAWLAALLLFVLAALPTVARAATASAVIVAGREAEITALARPYFGEGKEIAPGYKLGGIEVQVSAVRLVVHGPNGARGTVTLHHPSTKGPASVATPSFAADLVGGEDPGMSAALNALLTAVRANDSGRFWSFAPTVGPHVESPASRYAKPGSRLHLPRLPVDGVIVFGFAVVITLLHLRRVLRAEPRAVTAALVALVALGAVLRLTISVEAPMNVWPYDRVVPLARAAYEGKVLPWVARVLHVQMYLSEVIFKTTTVIAIFTPLAFFAHARFVLRDTRRALFAAALLVVLPNHIHFARADSEFIQSLATSSLTFVTMYTALRDESRAWRWSAFALLPLLSLLTYFIRPENLFFWAVDVGAIFLASSAETPKARKVVAVVEVTCAAAFAFVVHLLAQYQSALKQGLSLATLLSALRTLFDPRLNTLINPAITPPGLTLLAVLGVVSLVRRKEAARAAFLVAWLLGFFVVHSIVVPSEPAMQARYHMHLITPFLFLAASALPLVSEWPRRLLVAGGVYLAASPLVHLRFERDVDFNEMNEFAFIREVRASIPDTCTVLELSPAEDPKRPEQLLSSRFLRMAQRIDGGVRQQGFAVVNSGRVVPGDAAETLSEEASDLLGNPPPCLMVYTGLTCFSHRPPGSPIAPVCARLLQTPGLVPVAARTFGSRVYDEVLAGRLLGAPGGETKNQVELKPGEPLTMTMFRLQR